MSHPGECVERWARAAPARRRGPVAASGQGSPGAPGGHRTVWFVFCYHSPVATDTPPLLSEADAAFVQRRTSMTIAARDAQNRPVVARAFGCRVSADRRRVTVFLGIEHSPQALDCLRENGAIALAVTRPRTHETLQLKGQVLDIAPLSDEDRAEMAAYQQSFVDELASIGYRTEFARSVLDAGSKDCVAVTFAPAQLFNQTPGPKAGQKLGPR